MEVNGNSEEERKIREEVLTEAELKNFSKDKNVTRLKNQSQPRGRMRSGSVIRAVNLSVKSSPWRTSSESLLKIPTTKIQSADIPAKNEEKIISQMMSVLKQEERHKRSESLRSIGKKSQDISQTLKQEERRRRSESLGFLGNPSRSLLKNASEETADFMNISPDNFDSSSSEKKNKNSEKKNKNDNFSPKETVHDRVVFTVVDAKELLISLIEEPKKDRISLQRTSTIEKFFQAMENPSPR